MYLNIVVLSDGGLGNWRWWGEIKIHP